MTYTEKIIARHLHLSKVIPGETYLVPCNLAVGSEIIFPHILNYLNSLRRRTIEDLHHIAMINGHLVPTREAAAGTLVSAMDRFARLHPTAHYFQAG
ncbi:MAG: hypothetical protein ACK4OO_04335, partial [bacterium]